MRRTRPLPAISFQSIVDRLRATLAHLRARRLRPIRTLPVRLVNSVLRPLLQRDSRRVRKASERIASAGRRLARVQWRRIAMVPLRSMQGILAMVFPDLATARRRKHWLHTNACGDFTLLAREDWFRLRGYPEWPIFSWHLDSAFLYTAAANGVTELALGPRYRIYHIEHGAGWTPRSAEQLFARLDAQGIRYFRNEDLKRWHDQVEADPHSGVVNGPDWGLANRDLVEREIGPRGRLIGPAAAAMRTSA